MPGTPSQQTNLHYSLDNLPWCHWANTVTKASTLIIKYFLQPQLVDVLPSRCCELTPRRQKCNSKPKIMGLWSRATTGISAVCLLACREKENALCMSIVFWLQGLNHTQRSWSACQGHRTTRMRGCKMSVIRRCWCTLRPLELLSLSGVFKQLVLS